MQIVFGLVGLCRAEAGELRDYRPHNGYVESVENERQQIVEDVVIIPPPPPLGPSLRDRIFNEKLSRDFTDRYEQKFGRTEQQRVFNSPNRLTYYDDLFGFRGTAEAFTNEHRRFGNFMLRKLAEHHIENYAKNDREARAVWNVKERLSSVDVKGPGGFKFKAKYNISANIADINLDNPYIPARIVLEMGGSLFRETILSLMKPVTKTITVEGHLHAVDGVVSVIGRKRLSPALGMSLTTSTYTHDGGYSRRESLYLAGVSYSF